MAADSSEKIIVLSQYLPEASQPSVPDVIRILHDCRDLAVRRSVQAVETITARIEAELVDLANRAESRKAQSLYQSVAETVAWERPGIVVAYRHGFLGYFRRGVQGTDEGPKAVNPAFGELELLADGDLELDLAFSELEHALRDICEDELPAFNQRVALLLNRPDLDDKSNPLSPKAIAAAWRAACNPLPLDLSGRLLLVHLFEGYMREEVPSLYRDLNVLLKTRNVLPNARVIMRRTEASETAPATLRDVGTPDTFATLHGLLSGNAAAAGPAAEPSSAASGGTAAAPAGGSSVCPSPRLL